MLVNNVAVLSKASASETTTENMQRTLHMNVTSPFVLTREALPELRKAKGNVVFISSVGGEFNHLKKNTNSFPFLSV